MPRCSMCHRRVPAGAVCPADGQRVGYEGRPVDDRDLIIDGFALAEPLGWGGFATTFAGQAADGRAAAVKVSRAPSRAAAERLAGEARALTQVGSPSAPEVLALGESRDGRPYLAMERIHGQLWADWLAGRQKPASAAEVVELGTGLIQAVGQVHRTGLRHGDLKPENVFVCDGLIRLIDFGVGGAGTVEYAAPEQVAGGSAQTESDVYAIGVMLYELATGRPPFVGDRPAIEYGHTTLSPPPPSSFADSAAPFDDILVACLAKQPAKRPGLAELAAALKEAPAAAPSAARPIASAARRTVERRPVVLMAVWPGSTGAPGHDIVVGAGGFAVGQRGSCQLFGLSADAVVHPARTAHELASRLVAQGHRVALHVAPVTVRARSAGPPLVAGRAIDPGSWLPAQAWDGLWTSGEFDAAFPRTPDRARASPLVGRDQELAEIDRLAEQVADQRVPALITVCGASGTGKSRLLDEIARRAERLMPGATRFAIQDGDRVDGEALRSLAREHAVVVTVDDAERLADSILDAIEYAALDGTDLALVAAVAAQPILDVARPSWGARVHRHGRIDLGPLDRDSAMQMVADLLEPAEYPPQDALALLADRADRLPGAIRRVCEEVHARGWIAPRPGGSHRLVTERLSELEHGTGAEWAAATALARLPGEVADLARVCACLVAGFDDREVETATAALAEHRGSLRADTEVGLFQLASRGLLSQSPDHGWHMNGEQLRAGIAATLSDGERRHIDEAVIARVSQGDCGERDLAALAHHAERLGRTEQAGRAHHRLARRRARAHRLVEAERHYSAALDHLADSGIAAQVLVGRGRVRYLLGRHGDALSDLERAQQLAERAGDSELAIGALFEQATALDWAGDYAESALRGQQAIERAGSDFEAERALAAGRSAWRDDSCAAAIDSLSLAALAAAANGDDDIRTVALLLLGPALVRDGQLDRAERCFEEVIDLCQRAGDRLHLCAAYGNRMFLWSARKRPDLARTDLRQAVVLARQIGHPGPERVATFNLAEDLYWSGEDDREAFELAQRSRFLQTRFLPYPAVEDALLVARVALALSEDSVARDHLTCARRELEPDRWSEPSRIFAEMIEARLSRANRAVWDALIERASSAMGGDDSLEIVYWAASSSSGQRRADLIGRARPLLADYPIWRRRFESLEPAG